MHMPGTPQTMQNDPRYDDVIAEVSSYFDERIKTLVGAGIELHRIALDPGIGFGKTLEHNLELLAALAGFQKLKRPLLLGVSRKSFLSTSTTLMPLADVRLPSNGSTA